MGVRGKLAHKIERLHPDRDAGISQTDQNRRKEVVLTVFEDPLAHVSERGRTHLGRVVAEQTPDAGIVEGLARAGQRIDERDLRRERGLGIREAVAIKPERIRDLARFEKRVDHVVSVAASVLRRISQQKRKQLPKPKRRHDIVCEETIAGPDRLLEFLREILPVPEPRDGRRANRGRFAGETSGVLAPVVGGERGSAERRSEGEDRDECGLKGGFAPSRPNAP